MVHSAGTGAGAGAGSGAASDPARARSSIAFAAGSADVGVSWTWCCFCQAAAPALTCRSCSDVFCEKCFAAVHQGRMAAHGFVRGVALDALPAPNLAAQSVRDAEAEWVAAQRRSYITTAKESLASIRHHWSLWLSRLGRGPPKPEEVAEGNPEVSVCVYVCGCGVCVCECVCGCV
jgi:hypothetical protein